MRFITILAVLTPSIAMAEEPYAAPKLDISPHKLGFTVRVALARNPGVKLPTKPVPYTVEPYTLTVRPQSDKLVERDIFGTGLTLDLNGDGDTNDTLTVGCAPDGDALVEKTRFPPLGLKPARYRDKRGAAKLRRLGKRGARGLLYSRCAENQPITFGLSPARRPIRLRSTPGPALQVMLMEPVANPTDLIRASLKQVTVNGKKVRVAEARAHVFERLTGTKTGWAATRLVMIPLPRKPVHLDVHFEVRTGSPEVSRLMALSVNVSPAPNVRVRGKFIGASLQRQTGR